MTDEQRINDYARRLGWSLQQLDAGERQSLVNEIRSHLNECADGEPGALDRAIEGLGAPHALGRRFLEEYELSGAMASAGPVALVRAMLGRSSRRATAVLTAFAGSLCYVLAIVFAAMAVCKPFVPTHVGAWRAEGVWQVGLVNTVPGTPELLGLWLVPLAVALTILFYLAGTLILRAGGRRMLAR